MTEFWTTLRKSIYGPGFYSSLPTRPFRASLGYFFLLIVSLSLISTVVVSMQVIPRAMTFLGTLGGTILNYYPDGLEITATKGEISTNVTEPYFFKMPDALKGTDATGTPDNLLVIDTKNTFTLDLFKQYNTLALLTKTNLVYNNKGEIRIESLNGVPDGTLTKTDVAAFVRVANSFFRFIPALLVILIFLGLFFISVFQLIYLLFGALIIWLILRMRKIDGKYKLSYQIGLHALTLSAIISTLFALVSAPTVPFLSTIIFIIVAVMNLKTPPQGMVAASPVSG